MDSAELNVSSLGTLEYWQNHYRDEIENFKHHGDTGEVWFGEDIQERVVGWICKCPQIKKISNIVDVGCGNGVLLVELANRGFNNLSGIDYSEEAIVLAREVAENLSVKEKIVYLVCDILQLVFWNSFDVVVDKGTYDAISLSEDGIENRKKYIKNVHSSLKSNGLLVLTSCNWTRKELDTHFHELFEHFDRIQTPQFQFGGNVGNTVTCVIYKKSVNL